MHATRHVANRSPVYGDNNTWWSFTVATAAEPQASDAVPPAPDERVEAEARPFDRTPAPVDLLRRESVARRRRSRRDRRPPVAAGVLDSGVPCRQTAGGLCPGLLGLLLLAALLAPQAAQAQAGDLIEYYHLDALGTVRAVTDAGGNLVRSHDFKPFGEEVRDAQGQVQLGDRKLFTGQDRDTETGLDYFGARYYRAGIGRFSTVDPDHVNGGVEDPQSWNGFTYARSNPLQFIDPDGRRWFVKGGNAIWVEPNKDGSYTSPGEGWVELDPKNYDRPNVAFVDGVLSWISETGDGKKILETWKSAEPGLQDASSDFLVPLQIASLGATAVRAIAGNRLPSVAFKMNYPA